MPYREHARSFLCASVELVRVRASTHGSQNRTAAQLDRETRPDLTWQWTLAVVVCAALAGVFKKRKLNSITKINIRNLIELIK